MITMMMMTVSTNIAMMTMMMTMKSVGTDIVVATMMMMTTTKAFVD
jgi:hypothetical protein